MLLILTAAGFSHPEQCTHKVALVLIAKLLSRGDLVFDSLGNLHSRAAKAPMQTIGPSQILSVLLPSAATTAQVELQSG